MTTYTLQCVETPGPHGPGRCWVLIDGDTREEIGRPGLFESDLGPMRVAAGIISEREGVSRDEIRELIPAGVGYGGGWVHAGYDGEWPIYRVSVVRVKRSLLRYLSGGRGWVRGGDGGCAVGDAADDVRFTRSGY